MRSPISNNPVRAYQSFTVGALSPREASVRLARVEFDVARLEREIAVFDRRLETARRLLARHAADRAVLLEIIGRTPVPATKGRSPDAA